MQGEMNLQDGLAGSLGRGGKCVKRWLRAGCRICTSIETGARKKTKNFTQRTQRAEYTEEKDRRDKAVPRKKPEGGGCVRERDRVCLREWRKENANAACRG